MTDYDRSEVLQELKTVLDLYASGALGGESMPEDVLAGVVPADDLLNVLTLGMALNYQRNSYALWKSVANAYADDQSRWVFDIAKISQSTDDALRDVLVGSRVALQPNRHPSIWRTVAGGIRAYSNDGTTRGLFMKCDRDVGELKSLIQGSAKKSFPYLSGPKIFNYWLYVVDQYCELSLSSKELITVAPDTHIMQSSVVLGLCPDSVLEGREIDRVRVSAAWEELLGGSGLSPIEVHTPLWLWSRAGFPGAQRLCVHAGGAVAGRSTVSGAAEDARAIRSWAAGRGIQASSRGRVSAAIREAYKLAHS